MDGEAARGDGGAAGGAFGGPAEDAVGPVAGGALGGALGTARSTSLPSGGCGTVSGQQGTVPSATHPATISSKVTTCRVESAARPSSSGSA
jgi:hypothetical protein